MGIVKLFLIVFSLSLLFNAVTFAKSNTEVNSIDIKLQSQSQGPTSESFEIEDLSEEVQNFIEDLSVRKDVNRLIFSAKKAVKNSKRFNASEKKDITKEINNFQSALNSRSTNKKIEEGVDAIQEELFGENTSSKDDSVLINFRKKDK